LNWKNLEHFPLLMCMLATKTLILRLAFAGAKTYQTKKREALRLQQHLEGYRLPQSLL
uniref:Uncharacterized protein n=1 Tax=Salvator merianae TaxID=96440 RepID=A0A8D0C6S8_SALMN